MIVCILELWRGGDPDDRTLLGRIEMANDLIESLDTGGSKGTYNCLIYKKRKTAWRRIKIRNFPRLSYHPWNLVREILNKAAEQNGGRL